MARTRHWKQRKERLTEGGSYLATLPGSYCLASHPSSFSSPHQKGSNQVYGLVGRPSARARQQNYSRLGTLTRFIRAKCQRCIELTFQSCIPPPFARTGALSWSLLIGGDRRNVENIGFKERHPIFSDYMSAVFSEIRTAVQKRKNCIANENWNIFYGRSSPG